LRADWLYNELEGVDILTANASVNRAWLLHMNAGAEMADVSIQYCMAYPRHALQSVELSQVTQIRASDDHVPGDDSDHHQWRIGYSSILAWALGLAPFKDNYWSTASQPGGSCGNAVEITPALQEAISLFSAGPVTPGDGIGFSDTAMIMRTCNTAGRLLQPNRAATSIDSQVVGAVFPSATTPRGDVYATYSYVSGWMWDHVLAGMLSQDYNLLPSDVAGIRSDAVLRGMKPRIGADMGTVAYSLNATSFDMASLVVQPFSTASPVALKTCQYADFQVWHTAPVFQNGWAYLGELTKWVPVADARTKSIDVFDTSVVVSIIGQAGEQVPLSFYDTAAGELSTVVCTVGVDGSARAMVPGPYCA
jgi:hypothetical protein